MLTYLLVNISVIFLATFFLFIKGKGINKTTNISTIIFLVAAFLILFIISGFRGDFTSDYKSNSNLYHFINSYSWSELFNHSFYQEPGYIVLNKLIGSFTNNEVYLFLVTALLIIVLFFREFKRDSRYIWLSVLLFINIGAYYTSFNITRYILAVSIIFAGSKYIYNRELIKYVITIFIASLFHQTSWLMLPFYFLLNIKFNLRNAIILVILSLFTMVSLDSLIGIGQSIMNKYSGYTYGMAGLNITSVIVPIAILIFVIIHNKLVSSDTIKYRVWLNASVFYTFFSILGLKVQMLQRFAEFFSPYVLLIVPLIISNIYDKNIKSIYILFITFFLIAYNLVFLSGTGYDPYYFIWE